MSGRLHTATGLHALLAATRRAARGKRHRPAVARFLMDAEAECLALQRGLRRRPGSPGAWRPSPAREVVILDPKPRTISIVPFPDRVVHHALMAAVEADLERYAIPRSFACRRGGGQHAAVARARRWARSSPWVLKADVSSYFASIPHDRLLRLLWQRGGDREVHAWFEAIVGAWCAPGASARGLPIGSLTSQHLANLYLGPLDHWLTDGLGRRRYLRYMDDFLVFGDRGELRALLPRIAEFLARVLDLRLNARATRVMPVRDGVPLLGWRVYPALIRVRPDRWRRVRTHLGSLERERRHGQIDDDDLAQAAGALFSHLAHGHTLALRRAHLARRAGEARGGDRETNTGRAVRGSARLQPGQPRRLLEERQSAQPACGQSQQERPVQPQRQRRFPSCELRAGGIEDRGAAPGGLVASGPGPRSHVPRAIPQGPDGDGSRSVPLCPGTDPAAVPRPVLGGTEPAPAGGGPRRGAGVAAGHRGWRGGGHGR